MHMTLAVTGLEFVEVLSAVPVTMLAVILSGVSFRVVSGELGAIVKPPNRHRKQQGKLNGRIGNWKDRERKRKSGLKKKSGDWKGSKRKWKERLSRGCGDWKSNKR